MLQEEPWSRESGGRKPQEPLAGSQRPQDPGSDWQGRWSLCRNSRQPRPPCPPPLPLQSRPAHLTAIPHWLLSAPVLYLGFSLPGKPHTAASFLFTSQRQCHWRREASLHLPCVPMYKAGIPFPLDHVTMSTFLEALTTLPNSLFTLLCTGLWSVSRLEWTLGCLSWPLLYPWHLEQRWHIAGIQQLWAD